MNHRDSHPIPVDDCFGCKVQNVGVQTLQIKHGNNPIQTVPVIADEGARAGKAVGHHKVHWDGRQDAVAQPAPIRIETKVRAD
jgi:hypothetical protein